MNIKKKLSLPVYAEPVNEVITEETVEIAQDSSQDAADVRKLLN